MTTTETTDLEALAHVAQPTTSSGELTGPWNAAFWVYVHGAVQSKSNYRQDRANARGRWAQLSGYEDDVFATLRAARPRGWDQGNPDQAVADRPTVVAVLAARSMLDVGNLSKSILDAAEGVLYVSDAQVGALSEFSTRTKDRPGLIAAFAHLDAGTTAGQSAVAVGNLLTQVAAIACPAPPTA